MAAPQDGPVAVAISGYNPLVQYYSSGIISDAEGCGTKIDHAALVVGYGVDERGTKFWLVRTSWGRGRIRASLARKRVGSFKDRWTGNVRYTGSDEHYDSSPAVRN